MIGRVGLAILLSIGSSSAHAQTIPQSIDNIAALSKFEPDNPSIKLVKVAEGFEDPVNITNAGDSSGRLFVVEREGRIKIIQKSGAVEERPFLDLTTLKPTTINQSGNVVQSDFIEQGLFSVAFHPNYERNGHFYVHYTSAEQNGASVVYRFSVNPDSPNHVTQSQAIESSKLILQIDQPSYNNNGGQLAFGPDGYLYISLGDGGFNSPKNASQEMSSRLGKILRIDVDGGDPYAIPDDNPFLSEGGTPQDEVWVYGFHNPYKFAFDEKTGGMFVADVGDSSREEINYLPPKLSSGLNYGWPLMEGSQCYSPTGSEQSECNKKSLILPVFEYNHPPKNSKPDPETGAFACASVQGIGVAKNAPFEGVYMFGDWCSGKIYGVGWDGSSWNAQVLAETNLHITAGGIAENGSVHVLSAKFYFDDPNKDIPPFGTVWRVDATR